MNRILIYPYKMSSESSKKLAQALREVGHKVLRVYPDRNYRPRPTDLIINWGNSSPAGWDTEDAETKMVNYPETVANSTNKLKSFFAFSHNNVPTVDFTTEKLAAEQWLEQGFKVFCRTTLTGHSGNGIIIATTPNELVDAPLYTKQFFKTREYRIHVWGGEILDCQEKKRREEAGSRYDVDIWNHSNDFVYARQDVVAPERINEAAIAAVQAIGLTFGAVDIGYNHRNGDYAVFEVNSAPGLHGTTLIKYAEKIDELFQHRIDC